MSLTGLREMVVLARGNVGDDRVMAVYENGSELTYS